MRLSCANEATPTVIPKEIGEEKIILNPKIDLRAQRSDIEKLAKRNLVMQAIENDGRNEKLQKQTTVGGTTNITADLTHQKKSIG